MKEFAALRQKTYSYLTDDNNKNIKTKDTKSVSYKNQSYKHFLDVTQLENKINHLEKKRNLV